MIEKNSLVNKNPIFVIDEHNQIVNISGNSFSEEAVEIWTNFLIKFKKLAVKWDVMTLNLKFNVYNTNTTKQISFMIKICADMAKQKRVEINWYYPAKDTDMMESAEDYKEIYPSIENFNLIETR